MPEPSFTALAERLAGQVRQPDFALLRARRRRRSQRHAVAGVTALAVLVVLGGALVTRRPSPAPPLVTLPSATTMYRATPTFFGSAPLVRDGAVYAIVAEDHRVPGSTGLDSSVSWRLVRSTDLGARWTTVSDLTWVSGRTAPYLYGGWAGLWVYDPGSQLIGFAADGQNFRARSVASIFGNASGPGELSFLSSPDGAVVWGRRDGRLARLDGPTGQARLADLPSRTAATLYVPLDGDRLLLRGQQAGPEAAWYLTVDGAHSWLPVGDPCAGTSHPATEREWASVGGGAVWFGCGPPGNTSGRGVDFVSGTDGRTWQSRGTDPAIAATKVFPLSPTVAWRLGGYGTVYRTTDGRSWQSAGIPGVPTVRGLLCAVVDPASAVCLEDVQVTPAALHSTTDGGAHWTAVTPLFG